MLVTKQKAKDKRLLERFNTLVQLAGHQWTAAQREDFLRTKHHQHAGPGEYLYKLINGFPLDFTQNLIDVPEIGAEIKSICWRGNKADSLRFGQKTFFSNFIHQIYNEEDFNEQYSFEPHLSREELTKFRNQIFAPNISKSVFMSLKPRIRDRLLNFKISDARPDYQIMVLTSPVGYLEIKKQDFDAAFKLANISGARPIFNLQLDFIEAKIQEITSFCQNLPNIKSINEPGHMFLKALEVV